MSILPTIRTPQEFVNAIPFLIGFHPQDSIVAVVVTGGLLQLSARCDIAYLETDDSGWVLDKLTSFEGENTRIFLAGFAEHSQAKMALEKIMRLKPRMISEAIVVDRDQWWFVDEPIGVPGRSLMAPDMVSEILGHRSQVLSSREELVASVAAPVGEKEDRMLGAIPDIVEAIDSDPVEAGKKVVLAMHSWSEGSQIVDEGLLEAAMVMSMGSARDQLWTTMTNDKARQYLGFWQEVLRVTPTGVRVPALTVAGMMAWIAGNGALMNICLQEAETTDPHFPLVGILRQISQGCIHPQTWSKVESMVAVPAA